jgi:signal transduction histidine kinase
LKPEAYKPRVLVVDDDRFMLGLVARVLSAKGYQVFEADHGAAALDVAGRQTLDLVLLDVLLPGENGYDVCRRIRQQPLNAEVPVIFLTGMGGSGEMLEGFAAGGVDYVVKPFEPEILLARVRTHTELAILSRGLKAALRRHSAELEASNARMRELNIELALAEESERVRLAQSLHDTTIQQLTLANVLLEGLAGADSIAPDRLQRIADLVRESCHQLRTLVFELNPPMLEEDGLGATLEWLAQSMSHQWGLQYRYGLQGTPVALPRSLAVTLYQGARELMVNAAKHAGARCCEITLRFADDDVGLCVSDDGSGFEYAPVRDLPRPGASGYGLFALASRMERFGGSLAVHRRQPHGARVCLRVPRQEPPRG